MPTVRSVKPDAQIADAHLGERTVHSTRVEAGAEEEIGNCCALLWIAPRGVGGRRVFDQIAEGQERGFVESLQNRIRPQSGQVVWRGAAADWNIGRSEEHTSELQSRLHLVC